MKKDLQQEEDENAAAAITNTRKSRLKVVVGSWGGRLKGDPIRRHENGLFFDQACAPKKSCDVCRFVRLSVSVYYGKSINLNPLLLVSVRHPLRILLYHRANFWNCPSLQSKPCMYLLLGSDVRRVFFHFFLQKFFFFSLSVPPFWFIRWLTSCWHQIKWKVLFLVSFIFCWDPTTVLYRWT